MGNTFPAYGHRQQEVLDALERFITHGPEDSVCRRLLRQILSISELSRQYNISRKTAYKWIDRYLEEGSSGLVDRSRRPLVCPHQTPTKLVEALLEARRHHPTWGAKKLLKILSDRQHNSAWPSRKMIVVELLLINRYSNGLLSEAPNARINRRAIKIELKNQANCESG